MLIQVNTRSQAGVVIPILAAGLFGFLTFFAVYAIDVNLFNKANVMAQSIADDACMSVTSPTELLFASRGLQKAAARLPADANVGYGRISMVRLIVPVPLLLKHDINSLQAPFDASAEYTFSSLGLAGCPANVLGDCFVTGDVGNLNYDRTSNPSGKYPVGFWNRREHNLSLGCEVEIVTSPLILSPSTAKGKAVVGLEHRGKSRLLPNPYAGGLLSDSPSFLVALAPQAATPEAPIGSGTPYRFSGAYSGFDPLLGTSSAFEDPDPASSLQDLYNQNYVPAPNGYGGAVPPFANVNLMSTNVLNLTALQKEELRSACYNPFVAARNLFMQTLWELISRAGVIGLTSQFAIVNTQHDAVLTENPPTIVKRSRKNPGSIWQGDPMNPLKHVLPFMNHVVGTRLMCGFEGESQCNAFNRIRMSQLRHCFHMYTRTSSGGINTALPARYADPLESSLFVSQNPLHDVVYPGALATWGQMQTQPELNAQRNTRKSVKDLMRTMGVVQSCPFTSTGSATSCVKPANPSNPDLNPDYVALFKYASIAGPAYPELGLIWHPTRGFEDPVNLVQNLDPSSAYPPPPATPSVPAQAHPSDIVLVISQRIPNDQIAAIRNAAESFYDTYDGRIFVIFFARSSEDEDPPKAFPTSPQPVLDSLKTAFYVESSPGVPTGNVVIRIAPDDSLSSCLGGYPHNQACFQQFYEDMLTFGGDRSAQLTAEHFFETYMMGVKAIL